MALIEDYGLIGDLQSAALVSRDGSVDWLCLPRFDSGALFAALLGDAENGHWTIQPAGEFRSTRRQYRGDTLVLETELETDDGAVRLIDFMPPRETKPDLVRIVEGVRGRVEMRMELVLRFDYGSIVPWVRTLDGTLLAIAGPDAVLLRTPVEHEGRDLRTVASFTVAEGDRVPFVLRWFPSNETPPEPIEPEEALADTVAFWEDWASRCTYEGRWHDAVHRSLLTLKALTYAPTGGIVAAPTTSLPEWIGGVRNWDYRYCWLRDATLTLLALVRAGYVEEAGALARLAAPRDRGLAGRPPDHVRRRRRAPTHGVRASLARRLRGLAARPRRQRRVGPAPARRLRRGRRRALPVATPGSRGLGSTPGASRGGSSTGSSPAGASPTRESGRCAGRGGTSRTRRSWPGSPSTAPSRRSSASAATGRSIAGRRRAKAIKDEVLREGYNVERGAFTQFFGSDRLDASCLLIPLVGFLPATDERVVGTVRAIEQDLMRGGFVERYRADEENADVDGLPPGEGAFLPCSFWLAAVLAQQGRHDEAVELYERLLALRNDVGLISEEYDPERGRLVGNFPQAFTHIGIVETAFTLSR